MKSIDNFISANHDLTWTSTSPSPGVGLGMLIAFNCLTLPYPCNRMHFISFGRMGVRFGFGVVAEVGDGISFVIVDEDEADAVAAATDDEAGGGGLGNGCLLIFSFFVLVC